MEKQLLREEREKGKINVKELGGVLHGSEKLLERKQYLVSLVEADPILNDMSHSYRNHSKLYEMGLRKVCAWVQLKRKHNITDPRESTWMYYAIGEALPFDLHGSMFIPTLQVGISRAFVRLFNLHRDN